MSTQRFGFEGGGAGREGRHDVIFFERNGLRHGEFSLHVDQLSMQKKRPDGGRDEQWGYRVRELAWNSDSTVLAVWVEGNDGDVGKGISELPQTPAKCFQFNSGLREITTGMIFHMILTRRLMLHLRRYLKHEIAAPTSSSSEPGQFTSLSWHPEMALHLTLTTTCTP